jgi:hypothetical protein
VADIPRINPCVAPKKSSGLKLRWPFPTLFIYRGVFLSGGSWGLKCGALRYRQRILTNVRVMKNMKWRPESRPGCKRNCRGAISRPQVARGRGIIENYFHKRQNMKNRRILLTLTLISLTVSGQSLPVSVNLSAELPPVGDQGTVGNDDQQCQFWAALPRSLACSFGPPFSERHGCRAGFPTPLDEGSAFRSLSSALKDQGVESRFL